MSYFKTLHFSRLGFLGFWIILVIPSKSGFDHFRKSPPQKNKKSNIIVLASYMNADQNIGSTLKQTLIKRPEGFDLANHI